MVEKPLKHPPEGSKTNRQFLEESLKQLSSALSSDEVPIPGEGTALMQACEIVGQMMGLKFKTYVDAQTVEEIAEASEIRFKKVSLRKNWWKHTQEHFVGYYKNQPVALIKKSTGYEMIDPVEQKNVVIDAQTAEHIGAIAYTFYRTLPEQKVTFGKILELCLAGTKREYFSLFFVGLLATVIAFFIPVANKILFDYVIPDYDVSLFVQVIIGLILTVLSSTIFFFCRSIFLLRLDGIFENRLQMALWDRLLKLPLHFFRAFKTGDLIQRTFVIENLRNKLSENTLRIILNSFFGLIYVLVMFLFSWQLALLGIFIALIGSFSSGLIFFLVLNYQRKILASNAKINAFLIQVVNAIGKIRIAVAEQRVFSLWTREFAKNQRLSLQSLHYQNLSKTINTSLNLIAYLFVFATVIWLISTKKESLLPFQTPTFTIGSFLAFNAAFMPFLEAIFDLTFTLISIVELIPFWERAQPIFSTSIEKTSNRIDPGTLQGHIRADKVNFKYEKNAPLVIDDLSFHVNPSEFVAIVGPSGCGKSTLCRLLIGFETPDVGIISFDGKDLSTLDPNRVRSQMGCILQSTSIFNGTIKDNVTCGQIYSADQIANAIKLACFDEDLNLFPMGLETVLPSGGNVLSGGQKQRLLLTRALIRQPKILILDEATSSLDNKTQDKITRNLESLQVTRVVVAHRLSTIQNANRIYVMENGKIIDAGMFDELMARGGLFKRLYDRQRG